MRHFKAGAIFILLSVLILPSACSPTLITSTPTDTPTALPSPKPTVTSSISPQAAPTSIIDQTPPTPDLASQSSPIGYQMKVSLNYSDHTLSVYQIIDYTNSTGDSLTEIPLIVPPAQVEGAFSLLSLQADSSTCTIAARMDDGVIYVQSDPAVDPDQSIQLSLLFQLTAPEGEGAFGYTDRQLLLADWYPFIPPYIQGQGWLIHSPGDVGEYLSYPLSTFTVELQLSPPNESLVVAASAPLIEKDGNAYHYQAKDVRNFSLALSPDYQVVTKSSELVTARVYVFPEHADLGDRAADLILQAWERYTALYGKNPRNFLSMVEAEISDGLECDGLFYLSDWYFESADETPQNYFELLTVHETAHQWFYGLVFNDQANEPWLDEVFATYSEVLFYEAVHPELVQWWWTFRVWNYNPTGNVNGTIYEYQDSRAYINATYLRGVLFMQALRDCIGETAFTAFLSAYTQTEENDFRDSASFFDVLIQVSAADISHIVDTYFN